MFCQAVSSPTLKTDWESEDQEKRSMVKASDWISPQWSLFTILPRTVLLVPHLKTYKDS